MDYLISFTGIGIVVVAAYFLANAVYRRMKKRGSKAALVVYVLTFLVCIFLIGFIVLLIMVADGTR